MYDFTLPYIVRVLSIGNPEMTHITMGDSYYGAGAGYTLLIGIKLNKQFKD